MIGNPPHKERDSSHTKKKPAEKRGEEMSNFIHLQGNIMKNSYFTKIKIIITNIHI